MFGTRGWGLPRLQVGAKAMGTDKTMTKEHRQEQLAEEGSGRTSRASTGREQEEEVQTSDLAPCCAPHSGQRGPHTAHSAQSGMQQVPNKCLGFFNFFIFIIIFGGGGFNPLN